MAARVRVRIHRGASEVGGNCVELEASGQRLVLDVGLPLSTSNPGEATLPSIAGLSGDDASLRGIVLSHAHPDHYGLVDRVGADVPVYAGRATAQILREAAFFTRSGADLRLAAELEHERPLHLGRFTVTPYLVDHSAFDAYALLVEADGRRLFYSGDLRSHGRKQRSMERLFRSPPADVDVLLMEGTNVGRSATLDPVPSEDAVEDAARRAFRSSSSKNGTRCASRPARGEATRPGQRASRSSSSARPTSARIRAKTSMASATGGLTSASCPDV